MAPPPTHSPVTGAPVPAHYVHSSSSHFKDTSGRTLLLRGINLSSSAKSPQGQPGAQLSGFWETAKSGEMTFVGRVLDLENGKADEHLARLRGWGFNCLRYVITWESIEHKGPGQYDTEYIEYTVALLRKCKEYGFLVYIDPHQDLFSRFSGGSGAPYWTLIACGLEPENFTATNAACIECEWPSPSSPSPEEFPAMLWATNYSRLACQTLFTLWAAGRDYAPKCVIDGVNIQDWLQEHYFNAIRQLGNAIAQAGDLLDECVIGWDSLNEPNAGYLGIENLKEHGKESILRVGPMPTAFQGMRLAMGNAVEVENWKFGPLGPKRDGSVVIAPKGKRAWLDSEAEINGSPYGWTRGPDWELGTCVWALHGVWDPETDELLRPDYFDWWRGEGSEIEPRKVDYGADYWLPHWRRYAPVVREFHPEAIHFIQSPVFQIPPIIQGPEIMDRAAHSSHFYDGLTLVTKHWNWFNADALGILRGKYATVLLGVKVGESAIRKCLREQLAVLRQDTFDALGRFPTMMGEIGIPYDLDKKKAYSTGDYSNQARALDASLNACDGANALNYTIWTYCPDNSHEWGDSWNGEDLSIWSGDDAARVEKVRASTSQINLVDRITKSRKPNLKGSNSLYSLTPSGSAVNLAQMTTSARTNNDTIPSFVPLTRLIPSRMNSSDSLAPAVQFSPTPPFADTPSSSSSPYATPGLTLTPAPFASTLTLGTQSDPFLPINLNDGARAMSAFCRPYPVKTVGTPIDINFEIRSSKFTLSVKVEAGDVLDETVATEIFVPLVHYAEFPSRVSHLVSDDMNSQGELASDLLRYKLGSLALADEARNEDPKALALKVNISAGRWETEGQILRWYYPRPSTGSIIVNLELSRIDGAIPTWVRQIGVGADSEEGSSQGVSRFFTLGVMPALLTVPGLLASGTTLIAAGIVAASLW